LRARKDKLMDVLLMRRPLHAVTSFLNFAGNAWLHHGRD